MPGNQIVVGPCDSAVPQPSAAGAVPVVGAVTAGASTRTRQRVVNSTGSEGSLERCADVVCTAWVTVVASLAWLCVTAAVTEPSTARTAVAASIGHDPVHGTWNVRYVPDG